MPRSGVPRPGRHPQRRCRSSLPQPWSSRLRSPTKRNFIKETVLAAARTVLLLHKRLRDANLSPRQPASLRHELDAAIETREAEMQTQLAATKAFDELLAQ